MSSTIETGKGAVSSKRLWMARIATFFGYLQLGVALDMWSASTISVQHSLGLVSANGDVDYSSFGYVATAIGLGAVIGCLVSGPLADRIGSRKILWPTFVLFPLSFVLIGLTTSIPLAIGFGVFIGLIRGALDTVTSSLAVALEKIHNKPLMGGFQAIFPIGGFLGGLTSSHLITWLDVTDSPLPLYLTEGLILSALGLVFGYWTLTADEVPRDVTADATPLPKIPGKRLVTLIVLFGGLLIMSMYVESTFWDWGPSFGTEIYTITASAAALAIGVFSLGEFCGRIACDTLVKKLGESAVMFTSGIIGIAGVVVLIVGENGGRWLFTAGMFLVGLGVACMAPIMLSAAGRVDPANAGRVIGIVNGVGYFAMFLAPLAMTFITEHIGIGSVPFVALILLLGILVVSPLMSRFADKNKSFEEKFI